MLTANIEGGQIPEGNVVVSGAKNAATRLLAAALISDETVNLTNFPTELVDARHKIKFIENCGGEVRIDKTLETLEVDPSNYLNSDIDNYDCPIRTTYLLAAGLIKRSNIAKVPYPGGCKIGSRGYDLHIMVWEKLGAKVIQRNEYLEIKTEGGFKAGEINFPISTIGGTENALICAATVPEETIIRNAYISPEVECLIEFLKSQGVRIKVVGNSFISIIGSKYLRGGVFRVMPDRIEAITWIIYGILSKGKITVVDVPFDAMKIPLIHIEEAGIDYYNNRKRVIVSQECLTNEEIQPFELSCGTHPGIISDMQPFYVLLGLYADGISRVFDYRYPERLSYLEELSKFYPGALSWKSGAIKIIGKRKGVTADTRSTDLRGSMALLIAALLNEGNSKVTEVEMALRGYNKLQEKLSNLGVEIDLKKE